LCIIIYLLPESHNDLVLKFFTFFGNFSGLGITPGMRVEVAIVILGTFIYFYLKNLGTLRSLFYIFTLVLIGFKGFYFSFFRLTSLTMTQIMIIASIIANKIINHRGITQKIN